MIWWLPTKIKSKFSSVPNFKIGHTCCVMEERMDNEVFLKSLQNILFYN